MKLSKQEANLYYELMWELQFFVNKKFNVLPNVKAVSTYIKCSSEEKLKVRQTLYDNIGVIDSFIKANPPKFSRDKLDIIFKWKQFVSEDFHIERVLKKYAIFISSKHQVYGVFALYDGLDEMFHKSRLPLLVKGVLLPFKGKIIYDGLLQTYNVFFGGGISGGLKEEYMAAKQNGRIIETLEHSLIPAKLPQPSKPETDWKAELNHLVDKAKKLRGSQEQPALYSPIFSLIKASLELGQSAVSDSNDLDALWKGFKKVQRSLKSVETTLDRSER